MSENKDIVRRAARRVSPEVYLQARAHLVANDPDGQRMLEWSRLGLAPPKTPEDLAGEIVWIVLCAGRSAQSARTIEKRVWEAIDAGRPVLSAFGHRGKAAAIERAWTRREDDFAEVSPILASGNVDALVAWCGALPWVGDDTKFQLAKNFGTQVCKPDVWLCRLAGLPDRPRRKLDLRFAACMALCRALSEATGDAIAVVDSMLWLACNKGVLAVGPEAGSVTLAQANARRSIYDAAGSPTDACA